MAALYLDYWDVKTGRPGAVTVDKIVRFGKSLARKDDDYEDCTVIHLTDGTRVAAKESIKTLTARLERGGESP